MKVKSYLLHLLFIAVVCLTACTDNEEFYPSPENQFIVLSEDEISLGPNGRYYEVDVISEDSVGVRTENNWIELTAQTLGNGECVLEFYISRNDDEKDREGEIVFQSITNPDQTRTLFIKQSGTSSSGNNAVEGGLTSDFRVGYGYNIFQEYESERSMTDPVLNYDKLLEVEAKLGYSIIQEDNRSYEDIDFFSGYSLEELSEKFTKSSEKTTKGWLGATKTVKKYAESKESYTLNEECFGYARLKKITASRYLDEAALEYLINEGEQPFSESFLDLYETICASCKAEDIERMFKEYGTHIVTAADLGGMVEYMVDFKKSEVLNIETYTEVTSKYVFGKKKSNQEVENIKKSFSSSYSANKAFAIIGGDSLHIKMINDSIKNFTNDSQLPQAVLADWMNALEGDYTTDSDLRKRLAVVGCNIIPIWLLFKDKVIQQKIIDKANGLAEKYALTTEGQTNHTNRYCIPITDDMLNFSDGNNSDVSLVKVVYANKEPIIEICNEYVPKIRQDKRVNILYPLVNGKPNIGAGLYLGENGKDMAYVAFTEDDVVILPLSNDNQYTSKIYYINGALYLTDMGAGIIYLSDDKIKCEQSVYGIERYNKVFSGENYPLVKIGSNYWFRTAESYLSHAREGVFYTNYVRVIRFFNFSLPTSADFRNMLSYLCGNVKSLFIGQLSGFNAEFAGLVNWDLHQCDLLGPIGIIVSIEYSLQKCIMPCKDWKQYFAITRDYKVEEGQLDVTIGLPSRNIRPKDYKYSKLE